MPRDVSSQSKVNVRSEITEFSETYKALYELNMDATFILDIHGYFLSINSATEQLLRLDKHNIIGTHFSQFIHETYLQETLETFQSVKNGQPSNGLITVVKNAEGNSVKINVTVVPVYNSENAVEAGIGIAKDLSQLQFFEDSFIKVRNSLDDAQKVAKIGSWDYDVESDTAYWSKELFNIFAREEEPVIAQALQHYTERISPEDRPVFQKEMDNLLTYGLPMNHECRIITGQNEEKYVHVRGKAVCNIKGEVKRIIGTIHDITDQKLTEKKLREKEEQMTLIYNSLDEVIWSVDTVKNKILFCSKGFEDIFGTPLEKMGNQETFMNEIVHPQDRAKLAEAFHGLKLGKSFTLRYRFYHASGEIRWALSKTFPVFDSNGIFVRVDGIIWDVTKTQKVQDDMYYIAYHDHLTDLPNRRYFDRTAEDTVAEASQLDKTFTMLYIDLDRFKHTNDMLGHAMGDKLLQHAASRLCQACPADSFLARLGADEFAIILFNTNLTQAEKTAQLIIDQFQKPFHIQAYELHVTASIGITGYPSDAENVNTLLKNLDTALYQAKRKGKNKYEIFHPDMQNSTNNSYFFEKDLRKAIQSDELYLEYQPKVSPATGAIAGAEALIRWKHPQHGTISPGEFIPVAEESDLICDIGEWVIERVCRQMQQWRKDGMCLVPVSINISAHHLYKKDLVFLVKQSLKNHGIPAHLLEVEITESSLIQSSETVYSTLKALHESGVRLSLDDFGIGYSSLTHIINFHLDALKIDKSLIDKIPDSKENCIIISSLIQMAHGLKIKVVAEGVEKEEQLTFLRDHNCNAVQGYFYSKPVLPDAFASQVETGLTQ